MKYLKYRKTAAICGILATSLLLSACSVGRYKEITLTEQSLVAKGNFTEEQSQNSTDESLNEETLVATVILDGGQEEDATAVAGTSPLDNDLTMDSGFEERDETVYVTDNLVNIRSGCGKDYNIVTQLNLGDSIKRTGYSEGWSRVVYEDRVCYAVSDYFTTTNPSSAAGAEVKAFSETLPPKAASAVAANGRIVAIDAGHQAKGNSEKEPIGPGSSTMKEKVASGTEGISTGLPEYKLTLSVSQKLKRILEERGYQVVMIRDSNDVNISNAERAKMANRSGASAFVRIHANSLDNSNVTGVLTMCQTSGNPYNADQHDKSYSLSRKITDSISAVTGFKNRGVQETDTMSGINWCTIPVSIVEMGFMSNPEEDQKMAQDEYQEKLAVGIADGIDAYFVG